MKFDEKYYKDIWGTVHRHEYCETLANNLISKYGKCRILDIGTGCGYLVKLLREKGCEAYGLDISSYAVENSHGNVILGSVTDIPFKDNSFDVVHSQGLWEYIKEEDIERAYAECLRVGKIQVHNIDSIGSKIGEEGFVTRKTHEWWENKLKLKKVLVACPITLFKEYSLGKWIENCNKFTYPHDLFVADNSPTTELYDRWKDKVKMVHIDTSQHPDLMTLNVNLGFEAVREEFLKGDYSRLATIESDIIPPSDIIEYMFDWGRDSDWISLSFPNREHQENIEQGIGCCLFTRKLLEKYNFKDLGNNFTSDGGLWNNVRVDKRLKTMELWNYREIIHLKE